MEKVYKVVRMDETGRYYSLAVGTYEEKWIKEYKVGEWTEAVEGSLLFAFSALREAERWIKSPYISYGVLECEAEEILEPPKPLCNKELTWEYNKEPGKYSHIENFVEQNYPFGTVCAKRIKPILVIKEQKEEEYVPRVMYRELREG